MRKIWSARAGTPSSTPPSAASAAKPAKCRLNQPVSDPSTAVIVLRRCVAEMMIDRVNAVISDGQILMIGARVFRIAMTEETQLSRITDKLRNYSIAYISKWIKF